MADDETRAVTRRQLARLIEFRSRGRVLQVLGVDEGTLTGLLDGSADWPPDAREKFDHAWGVMVSVGAAEEVSDEADEAPEDEGVPDEVDQAGEVAALDPGSGGDENPAGGAEQPVVDAKPAAAADERVQDLLWRARYLVITRYLWPERGVPRHRRLSAWAVLLRLEIKLIRLFQCPLPRLWRRGQMWDAGQQRREISLRVDRLRGVKRQEKQLYLRRVVDWLRGRDEDRDEILLKRILADARNRGPVFLLSLLEAEPDWRDLDRMVPPVRSRADA